MKKKSRARGYAQSWDDRTSKLQTKSKVDFESRMRGALGGELTKLPSASSAVSGASIIMLLPFPRPALVPGHSFSLSLSLSLVLSTVFLLWLYLCSRYSISVPSTKYALNLCSFFILLPRSCPPMRRPSPLHRTYHRGRAAPVLTRWGATCIPTTTMDKSPDQTLIKTALAQVFIPNIRILKTCRTRQLRQV